MNEHMDKGYLHLTFAEAKDSVLIIEGEIDLFTRGYRAMHSQQLSSC